MLMSLALVPSVRAQATKRRSLAGRGVAVVVDERLATVRREPNFNSSFVRRLSRGSVVKIVGTRRAADGVTFYRVVVTRRTGGWLQTESVAVPSHVGDDARLLKLIRGSTISTASRGCASFWTPSPIAAPPGGADALRRSCRRGRG